MGAGFPGTPCLPQDPPEKHLEKRRDLSGPAPFPAPITLASKAGCPPHPSPFFSPPPLLQPSTPVANWAAWESRKGAGVEPRNWTWRGTGTAQEGRAGRSRTAGGCGGLGSGWRAGGMPFPWSHGRPGSPAIDRQKSEPGQAGVEAEAPPRPARPTSSGESEH